MSDKEIILVTTPIGNLGDITERARQYLEDCDCIIAEDTRSSKDLLRLLGIAFNGKNFLSFHEHNQEEAGKILEAIEQYKSTCIVSDAGSPVLSDPAFPLVDAAWKAGFKVTSAPGASAVTTALELSGLPPIPNQFLGFFPRKTQARKQLFEKCDQEITYIGFESPQRVINFLDDLVDFYQVGEVVIARELTKKFESVTRFNCKDWSSVKESLVTKGEFVVLWRPELSGDRDVSLSSQELNILADNYIGKPTPKNLAKLLSKIKGIPSQDIYNQLNKK